MELRRNDRRQRETGSGPPTTKKKSPERSGGKQEGAVLRLKRHFQKNVVKIRHGGRSGNPQEGGKKEEQEETYYRTLLQTFSVERKGQNKGLDAQLFFRGIMVGSQGGKWEEKQILGSSQGNREPGDFKVK